MKFCRNCYSPLKDDELFCSNCGTRVDSQSNKPAASDEQEQPIQKSDAQGSTDYGDNFDNQSTDAKNENSHDEYDNPENNIYSHSAQPSAEIKSDQQESYIKKVCPNCNQPLERSSSVCPYCGYDVARYNDGFDSPIDDQFAPPPPSKVTAHKAVKQNKTNDKGKTAIIVAAIVAAIVIITAAVMIFVVPNLGASHNTSPTNPSETQAATEAETEETEPETEAPTEAYTEAPTEPPTPAPTQPPTEPPTEPPTAPPTEPPTPAPTQPPTEAPTEAPTEPETEPLISQ